MRDKVGAADQISFVLNGKPVVPVQPVQPDNQQPPEPNEEDSINIEVNN